jgi:hypothetical protein
MFLIILLLIIIIYILFKNRKIEGFEEDENTTNKKCLICYYGGAFREGNVGTTITDTNYSYNAQENTSLTHAKLKKVLNEKGYQTDIIINTRETKYKNRLEEWYDPFNIIINKLSKNVHGKNQMIQSSIGNINKLNKRDYEFIFFIRIDLFLKPDFYSIIDTETNKIQFLAQNYDPVDCSIKINKNYSYSIKKFINESDPKVNDLFLFLPKKYYFVLDQNFQLEHWSWSYFKGMYKLIDNDMKFMTDKMFDSNTHKSFNDYYFMSGRDESTYNEVTPESNTCPKYSENVNKYIKNPTKYYIDKYKSFYI